MSYYYTYYVGYKTADGRIYPFGPYDCFGKLRDVLSRSRSFASDIHKEFYCVKDEMISEELRKEFRYEGYDGEMHMTDMKYLPVSELPGGSCLKKGYYLASDVQSYLETGESEGLFYDHLAPEVFAAKMMNEAVTGAPKEKKDEEGYDITPHSASDYMYFAYPDYQSRKYEAEVMRLAADMLCDYSSDLPKDAVPVILETEG